MLVFLELRQNKKKLHKLATKYNLKPDNKSNNPNPFLSEDLRKNKKKTFCLICVLSILCQTQSINVFWDIWIIRFRD